MWETLNELPQGTGHFGTLAQCTQAAHESRRDRSSHPDVRRTPETRSSWSILSREAHVRPSDIRPRRTRPGHVLQSRLSPRQGLGPSRRQAALYTVGRSATSSDAAAALVVEPVADR